MPRMPWERDARSSGASETSHGRRTRRGRDPHMELTHTLPLHVRPGDPAPTYTRLPSPQGASNPSPFSPMARKVPPVWGGSGASELETNTSGSHGNNLQRPPPTSQWTLSEANLRITAKERKVRKTSWESEREPGGVKCLVVDNDFAAFTSTEGDYDWSKDEKSAAVDHDDAKSIARSASHYSIRGGRMRHYAWYRLLVDQVLPFLKSFVLMSFPDKEQERTFQREQWHASKPGAYISTLFILLSTLLSIGSVPRHVWKLDVWYYYAYIGIAGGFTFPLVFFVLFDLYYKAYWIYQLFLAGAAWNWGFLLAIEMNNCGFFNKGGGHCGEKTYLNLMALLAGIPTLAMIGMKQNRLVHLIVQTSWTVFMLCLFMNQPLAKGNMGLWRNVILCTVYHYIFTGVAYFRERSDRQLFVLRSQLKEQYRAVQKAQEMERQAEHSKKRFVSYIFHEVRVPLNTARLALANLDAEGAFTRMKYDQRDLLVGLDGSLRMMEKVLNDVLSFNRMESGNLVLTRKPFNFHQAMQHVALAHRATAESADLTFSVETDPRIEAIGGIVVGDDMRFKQVCSNLISNAFKFTQTGGVRMVAKLLYPDIPQIRVVLDEGQSEDSHAARNHGPLPPPRAAKVRVDKLHASINFGTPDAAPALFPPEVPPKVAPAHPTKAVIRMEIHDTGVGLSLADVRDNRLFSPYVQTEIGRRQGGKGSGLGLALVTQIVKLCKGRLGVDSEPNKGSVFWFEIPFTLPTPEMDISAFLSRGPLVRGNSIADDRNAIHGVRSPPPPRRRTTSANQAAPPVIEEPTDDGHSVRIDDSPTMGEAESSRYPLPYPQPRGGNARASRASRASILPASPVLSDSEHHALSTLVVDDDELTRHLMSRMLIRLGHAVQVAEDGREALEILQRSFATGPPIDVVFLDNQMPVMSGVELARALRTMNCSIYIVACTGNALREDQDEFLAAGADVIITKPIHESAVVERLKYARERAWQSSLK